ncbi:MAG: response regulator [Bacteroidota bacterium]
MGENVKNVLVVDDSSVTITLAKKILQAQQFKIDGLKNGKEVMKKVEKNDYDLILLDINLPGKDGMTIAKEIRALKDQKKAKLPIIAISGNYKNFSPDDFDKVGINEFLMKPLDFDALVEKVKDYTS